MEIFQQEEKEQRFNKAVVNWCTHKVSSATTINDTAGSSSDSDVFVEQDVPVNYQRLTYLTMVSYYYTIQKIDLRNDDVRKSKQLGKRLLKKFKKTCRYL